jgi:hypothetical protein
MFGFEEDSELVEVIVFKDASVQCTRDEYAEYLKTLDESLLKIKEDMNPTRWVMKKTLTYGEQRKIKDSQVGFKDGDMTLRLGFMLDEVRFSLVDIKNAGKGVEFKKDSDGYVSKSLIEKLDAAGIVRELHEARQTALSLKSFPKKS